ncbi:MAG: thioredoxin family protein [Bacteroidota bacterium]
MFKHIFPALTSLLIIGTSYSQGIDFIREGFSTALQKAKNENKLVFIDVYTTWCGPCKWMDKNVFANDAVADFYNKNFICVKIDAEKGEGIKLREQYQVNAYPTFLYVNRNGDLVHRSCGKKPPHGLIEVGREAMDPNKQFSIFQKRYDNGNRSAEFMAQYITALKTARLPTNEVLSSYLATQSDSDLLSSENWNLIYQYLNDIDSREFQLLIKNRDQYDSLYTADLVGEKIYRTYMRQCFKMIQAKEIDEKAYIELKAKVKESGFNQADKLIANFDLRYCEELKDWQNFAKLAVEGAENFFYDDSQTLNCLAWNLYIHIDNEILLEKAMRWAKRSVGLEETQYNTDTYARILFKLGLKEEAVKFEEKALEFAKKSGSKDAEYLKKVVEEMKNSLKE